MKLFVDTNVYVAEALLGGAAEKIVTATIDARWRMFTSADVLDEIERVLTEKLGFSKRLGRLTRERVRRRSTLVFPPASHHTVSADPADSPILRAAIASGVDLMVTNDSHLLAMSPYEGLRIISINDFFDLLVAEGHLQS